MLFNSFSFLIFVVTTFGIYYCPLFKNKQILVLIIASFIFYAWHLPILTLLLFFSGTVNAFVSHIVFDQNTKKKLFWAGTGVTVNIFVLFFFKYNRLIVETIAGNLETLGGLQSYILAIPLPVGISFFTFQGISLVIDVYRGSERSQKLEYIQRGRLRHWYYSLFYISFFPQLVAGPIVKAYDFMPQISMKRLSDIDWDKVAKTLIIGYFLKMVIADNLKDYTYWIAFPYFQELPSIYLIALLFGFSMQIFADFAGYSLIAIGIGALFGYIIPVNFNFPYIAKSFSEFWNRWHISLSTWLKEYLYVPLGGNRKSTLRLYANLIVVMSLGGLWHGASWNFMVWGTFHGLLLAIERLFTKGKKRVNQSGVTMVLRIFAVFTGFTIAWPFFKLTHITHAFLYFNAIISNWQIDINETELFYIFLFSIPVIAYHLLYFFRRKNGFNIIRKYEFVFYAFMLFLITSNSGGQGEFIYFQF